MPLHSDIVGATTNTLNQEADARWLMAYAAGLNDLNPLYMDTQAHTVIAHPVFPVCLEWPVILDVAHIEAFEGVTLEESARAVHATHDLHLDRPIRAGDKLTTQATFVDLRKVRPGAASMMRLDTADTQTGELVARTYQTAIYRDVAVEGGDKSIEALPELPQLESLDDAQVWEIPVQAGAAHVYTECARIWNPIHTDRAVALRAGLPDRILHGTATLALSVSRIVKEYTGGDPKRVYRLGGRFAAMVLMPSTLRLETSFCGDVVSFQVRNGDGDLAIRDGFVCLK